MMHTHHHLECIVCESMAWCMHDGAIAPTQIHVSFCVRVRMCFGCLQLLDEIGVIFNAGILDLHDIL
jgi:hypothetical protein